MSKVVAVLATMDTKGAEAEFMRRQIEALGGRALLVDLGVVGDATVSTDVNNAEVAAAGGGSLDAIRKSPTRQDASPILIAGATKILLDLIENDKVHALVSVGGTQGTSNCTQVMQALPYGFPKVMVSTVASGDTSPFVGVKDITMMFSVSDLLGLNAFSRKILANAAAAAWGMAQVERDIVSEAGEAKPLIGMTNLGVLTAGAMRAIDRFHEKGYEVIPFHAVGSGGRAMEQMMKEGIIKAVFDYALGEIADEVFDGLRAGDAERLTVAGDLGLPQVIVPGGAEHIGLLLRTPNEVPPKYLDHKYTFHNPIVFAPRLNSEEIVAVANVITNRLKHTRGNAVFIMPLGGVSRYSVEGGELRDEASDAAFWKALREGMPDGVEVRTHAGGAEDDAFVDTAVDTLIGLIEGR